MAIGAARTRVGSHMGWDGLRRPRRSKAAAPLAGQTVAQV